MIPLYVARRGFEQEFAAEFLSQDGHFVPADSVRDAFRIDVADEDRSSPLVHAIDQRRDLSLVEADHHAEAVSRWVGRLHL